MRQRQTTIERDDPIQRARRTAAVTRMTLGVTGIALILGWPALLPHPALGIIGFATILLTSVLQLVSRSIGWVRLEESFAGSAAILIVGLGDQHVTVLSVLWLVAVATGVMARGGRVHWIGRLIVLGALALPPLREGTVVGEYAAFCAAVIGLQLTSGRLTLELNRLLRQARLEAENAETLLLAGDIAERVAQRTEPGADPARPAIPEPAAPPSPEEVMATRLALNRLIAGEGLQMFVQPIVAIDGLTIHAYEALARFGRRRGDRSPLHWLAIAAELGERIALERACLARALELFPTRPGGALLAVNLSVPALFDEATRELLADCAAEEAGGLDGLIVEITEETLIDNESEVSEAIDFLRARGARLAVDDIGAGYSGLRQITSVLPEYLKLDRSLVADIDTDRDRAALVSALAGYAAKVGSLLVAEGVERAGELDCVAELGAPLVQGFHLARPAPAWPELDVGPAIGRRSTAAGGDDARAGSLQIA
jgi:EAL domain-containing protein (putative c-di-GMP-specific phosphodiesterase class I)